MIQVDDLSRSLIAFEQISTLVIVVELSQSSWLAAGVVPGIERRPLKKLDPDPTALLHLVEGWRDRATKAIERSHGPFSLSSLVAMDFGWLDGCGSVASRPSSCIRRVSQYRASPAEPRRIGSILRCSSACFWDGCAASRVTAKWSRSPRSRKKRPGVPAASAKSWWANARGSSIA